MNATPEIITTAAERRQIARVLEFAPRVVQYIDWASVAKTASEMGANWEARWSKDESVTVTMFWAYAEGEAL